MAGRVHVGGQSNQGRKHGRTIVTWCALTLAVVYIAFVVLYILPLSAATYGARPVTEHLLPRELWQSWTLFAPTPPKGNPELLLQIRCGRHGQTSDFFDVSDRIHSASFADPLLPSRVDEYASKLSLVVPDLNPTYFELQESAKFDPRITTSMIRRRAHSRAVLYRLSLLRLLSAVAATGPEKGCAHPYLRGVLSFTPTPTFAHRRSRAKPSRDIWYDTGWLQPVRDVTSWHH
jgi:hypothetical protein